MATFVEGTVEAMSAEGLRVSDENQLEAGTSDGDIGASQIV